MPDPTRAKTPRREALEQRLEWLKNALAGLERDGRRAPFLLGVVLLAPFAGHWFGGLAALFVVICALILGFTAVYIVWVHRREYELELAALRRTLRDLPPDA